MLARLSSGGSSPDDGDRRAAFGASAGMSGAGTGVDGSPAVTRRAGSAGRGGAGPWLRPPEDVEIVRRSNGAKDWTFVINHSAQDVEVALDGVELLSVTATGGTLNVTAGGVAVVRLHRPSTPESRSSCLPTHDVPPSLTR
ncbi:Beta-galactosidase C-terminal domain [Arthrobacter sp. NPDC058127]|uniref:Beta-galactosidase C-terminal domain n=1 Tax=Arthrobacter sp. NPDC058127 TaxID=3346351 RepID=UPI0036E11955